MEDLIDRAEKGSRIYRERKRKKRERKEKKREAEAKAQTKRDELLGELRNVLDAIVLDAGSYSENGKGLKVGKMEEVEVKSPIHIRSPSQPTLLIYGDNYRADIAITVGYDDEGGTWFDVSFDSTNKSSGLVTEDGFSVELFHPDYMDLTNSCSRRFSDIEETVREILYILAPSCDPLSIEHAAIALNDDEEKEEGESNRWYHDLFA